MKFYRTAYAISEDLLRRAIRQESKKYGVHTCRLPVARDMTYPTSIEKLPVPLASASASAVACGSIRIFGIILRTEEKGNEI